MKDVSKRIEGQTIPNIVLDQASRTPTKIALSAHSADGNRRRLTYRELADVMPRVASKLRASHVKPGDRVALLLSNNSSFEVVLTALGCYMLGAVVAPLNVRYSDEELKYTIDLLDPSLIVASPETVDRLKVAGTSYSVLIAHNATELQQAVAVPASFPTVDPELPSCIIFTSGTTARPKAVVHSQRSQLNAGYAVGGAAGLGPRDSYQGGWPVFTSSVLNMACMSALVYGATVVLEQAGLKDPEKLDLISEERPTVYHGVTAPLNFLLSEYERSPRDISSIRRIVYGGAVMPVELIEKFQRLLPRADQVHIWGMTETGPAGTFLASEYLPYKAGSIGHPMPGCVVRIVDDSGVQVPVGVNGEIEFSGASAALRYYNDPEASAKTFVDGWVKTGDIGCLDEEGFFHFVDRKKDIVNRGGLKISSAAVEEVIFRFPGIAEAAVIAIPHKALGEDVAACIVMRQDQPADIAALTEFCAKFLADYERPRKWLVLDELPKNPMGKILKEELRRTFPSDQRH